MPMESRLKILKMINKINMKKDIINSGSLLKTLRNIDSDREERTKSRRDVQPEYCGGKVMI
jgi:hypothetical protein